MQTLTSGNLVFHTLPIQGYATIDGQAANVVNPATIKNIVQSTFYPKPVTPTTAGPQPQQQPGTAAAATTVDVLNGGGTPGLALRVSQAMVQAGFKAGQIGNATARATTEVLYGTGEAANASRIASAFGVTAAASASVAANHVEVLIGAGTTTAPTVSAGPSDRVQRVRLAVVLAVVGHSHQRPPGRRRRRPEGHPLRRLRSQAAADRGPPGDSAAVRAGPGNALTDSRTGVPSSSTPASRSSVRARAVLSGATPAVRPSSTRVANPSRAPSAAVARTQ